MPFEFFDFDPFTGVKESLAFEDGKIHVRYEQKIEPTLKLAAALRNEGEADASWREKGASTYAIIPAVVWMNWRKSKGIDIWKQDHMGAVLDEINADYKYLKTTDKTHTVK